MYKALKSSLLFFLLGACTVYQSEGRKQFENDSNGKISTSSYSFTPTACTTEPHLEIETFGDSSLEAGELVYTNEGLEAWLTHYSGSVEIKTILKGELKSQICTYQFESEEIWNSNKPLFFRELKNNMTFLE